MKIGLLLARTHANEVVEIAKKAEKALRKAAKKKFPGDKKRQERYIYGGKRNIGWKPKRER